MPAGTLLLVVMQTDLAGEPSPIEHCFRVVSQYRFQIPEIGG